MMTAHLANAAMQTPHFWFEVSTLDRTSRNINLRISKTEVSSWQRSFPARKDIVLVEVGKIGALRYFETKGAILYPVNAETEMEQPFDSYITTINEMTARISTGKPHPRAEVLGDLANSALISQSKETRSVAQWAKDLTNASFDS